MTDIHPLDDDELEALDELLEQYTARPDGYDVEQLDGFLAALAIGPVLVPPSRYLPVIQGGPEAGADAPAREFARAEDMQDFLVYLARHANTLARELQHPGKKGTAYVPVVFPDESYADEAEATKWLALKWALGFVEGMRFYEDEWDAAVNDSDALQRVEMLVTSLLVTDAAPEDELSLDERYETMAELPEALALAAADFAHARRQSAKAKTVVRESKVGRNDPCPCGSGRKYKHCCGK